MQFSFAVAAGLAGVTNAAFPQNQASLRSITGPVATILQNMKGYGCWCYLPIDDGSNFDVTQAKGAPQDSLDESCKVLMGDRFKLVGWNKGPQDSRPEKKYEYKGWH